MLLCNSPRVPTQAPRLFTISLAFINSKASERKMEFQRSWMLPDLPSNPSSSALSPFLFTSPRNTNQHPPNVWEGRGADVLMNGTLKKEQKAPPARRTLPKANWNWVPALPLCHCVTEPITSSPGPAVLPAAEWSL